MDLSPKIKPDFTFQQFLYLVIGVFPLLDFPLATMLTFGSISYIHNKIPDIPVFVSC